MGYEKLEFASFDEARLKASKDAWMADAKSGLAFPSEVERLLGWAATHGEPSDGDAAAFGIFRSGGKQALGLCEVAIQRKSARSKWVKMLRLHLRPQVDSDLQDGNSEGAMNVFIAALVGTMELQLTHKATTMKVYGRTNEQLNFLRALVTNVSQRIAKDDLQAKASIQGRYLVIETSSHPQGVANA